MSIDVQVLQPSLTVRPGETGRLKFTVTNSGQAGLPVVAQVVGASDGAPPLPPGTATLDRPGRTLPAGGMDEFVVSIAPPLTTPPATYGFVLHVASSSDDAVQVWGQSPQVAVTLPPVDIPRPPWWPKWLMAAAAVLVAVGIGFAVHSLTSDGGGWQVQTAVESQVLRPGESIVIGVTNAATEQRLQFEGGVGTAERLTVSDAPIASTAAIVGADDLGDACLTALDGAGEQSSVGVPIDGRPVCTFIGPGVVGVVIIQSLEFDQVTVSMDVWTIG